MKGLTMDELMVSAGSRYMSAKKTVKFSIEFAEDLINPAAATTKYLAILYGMTPFAFALNMERRWIPDEC